MTSDSSDHLSARLFNDPSCPWGYSANPSLRVLEWRYREQVEWELVVIGLSEPGEPRLSYTVADLASGNLDFRDRYGMPFSVEPKSRLATSSRSCQAIISARLNFPGSEWKVLRALQLLNFNTSLLLDQDDHLRAAISTVEGIDADLIVDRIDTEAVQEAYQSDCSESRQSAGGAGDLQGKTRTMDNGSRFTAPSVVFSQNGQSFEASGFQPVEAYDVLITNLNPGLRRTPPPESPLDAVRLYPGGLATQEVAAIMAEGNTPPDPTGTERELALLVSEGKLRRIPLGNDAIWLTA